MNKIDTIQTATDPYTEAAEWVERLSEGPLDGAEKRRLQQWLRSGGHRELFERMLATWGDPALAAAAGAIEAPTPKRSRRPLRAAGMAAAACLLCALAWFGQERFFPPDAAEPLAYESAIAEEKSVALEDGSEVSMEADTAVDVQYLSGARHIRLHRGAAYFAVARDRRRPFTVVAGTTRVEALGTEFSVDRIARGVDVRVHEGTVRVRRESMPQPRILTAGQQLRLHGDGRIDVRDFTPSRRGAWRSGWMDIDDESLHYLVEHLSRYSRRPIALNDPALRSLRIAGRFDLRDTGATLGLLGELYPLEVSHRDGRIVISARTP
ncbi:FecR family protein [Microbulbifer halophilus]|uniref:FecR family protein n=1 Tax=Microbulbifer halophilus TaxID=453963 RepID=A0ABW5EAR8_9GAMM|nr:FecR domain-containing protein [Microbulbifer halophilus]MCW8126463.1 FecR domain-containing protein [Microbulbifer halophilus]